MGSQVISPAVARHLSQHSHCQLGQLLDHSQTFQFSLLPAEDRFKDKISLDDNVHDFCFNSCHDSVQANSDVGFSEELVEESIQSDQDNSSVTKGEAEGKLNGDLGSNSELANVKGWLAERFPFWQHM